MLRPIGPVLIASLGCALYVVFFLICDSVYEASWWDFLGDEEHGRGRRCRGSPSGDHCREDAVLVHRHNSLSSAGYILVGVWLLARTAWCAPLHVRVPWLSAVAGMVMLLLGVASTAFWGSHLRLAHHFDIASMMATFACPTCCMLAISLEALGPIRIKRRVWSAKHVDNSLIRADMLVSLLYACITVALCCLPLLPRSVLLALVVIGLASILPTCYLQRSLGSRAYLLLATALLFGGFLSKSLDGKSGRRVWAQGTAALHYFSAAGLAFIWLWIQSLPKPKSLNQYDNRTDPGAQLGESPEIVGTVVSE